METKSEEKAFKMLSTMDEEAMLSEFYSAFCLKVEQHLHYFALFFLFFLLRGNLSSDLTCHCGVKSFSSDFDKQPS